MMSLLPLDHIPPWALGLVLAISWAWIARLMLSNRRLRHDLHAACVVFAAACRNGHPIDSTSEPSEVSHG